MASPQTNDSIVILVGVIGAFATVVASGIGMFSLLRSNKLSRTNDHKLAVLKVLLEAAYKEYEFRTKQDIEAAQLAGTVPQIKSFTEYIIFYRELSGLFTKENVTEADLRESLSRNKELIDSYYVNRERFRPEYHRA